MGHHFTKFDSSVPGNVFDADAAWADFGEHRHYIVDGVVRWSSNDSVPPADLLSDWFEAGCISKGTLRASLEARDVDTAAFCAEYRRRQPAQPSAEELFEMRAAFGGAEVVDVISGRRVRL
jgi:hypothetical protein